MKSYYSETIDGRANWWQNKLDNAALITSLLPAQAASILADAAMAVYLYRTLPQAYDKLSELVHHYCQSYLGHPDGTPAPDVPTIPAWPTSPAAVLAGIEARRMKWVQLLKKTTGYDPATTGVTLQTEVVGGAFDAATYQSLILSVVSNAPSQVTAKFGKARGAIDAMAFNGQKEGGTTMLDLGKFLVSPANLSIPIATPGQAENWMICGQAMQGDTLIGIASPFMPVLVRG